MSGGAGEGGHAKQMDQSVRRTGRKELTLPICCGESGQAGDRQSRARTQGGWWQRWGAVGPYRAGKFRKQAGGGERGAEGDSRTLLKVTGVSVRWPSAEESC